MAYIPIMLGTSVIFFVYNLCLVPIVFVKIFFHKLVMIFVYSKHIRVSRATKFAYAMAYVAYGLFSAFGNVAKDQVWFLLHCFKMD